jgi:hypothetical protein
MSGSSICEISYFNTCLHVLKLPNSANFRNGGAKKMSLKEKLREDGAAMRFTAYTVERRGDRVVFTARNGVRRHDLDYAASSNERLWKHLCGFARAAKKGA